MAQIKNKTLDMKKLEELPIIGIVPSSEKEEKYLKEFADYEFYNSEEPGFTIRFPYGTTKNKIVFTFEHGKKYKLPRHVARHVESCDIPIYKWVPDGTGVMQKTIIGRKSRFQMRQVFE